MIRRACILLFLSSPVFGGGSYGLDNPILNRELERNSFEHKYPNWVNATGSSLTVTWAKISTGTFVQVDATSGTVKSFMVVGTATNDDAPLGRIGEFKISADGGTVSAGTTGQFKDYQTLSLPPGDWDVYGAVTTERNGANVSAFRLALSLFSGNTTTDHNGGYNLTQDVNNMTATVRMYQVGPFRVSANATTTVYLKMRWDYSTATPQGIGGEIWARRMR